ncbi:MAG: energy transducer TonB [Acidobacteriota bacterium]
MLDQLVESRSHVGEDARKNQLLVGTLILAVIATLGAWTSSLFNKDFETGTGDLELSSLVEPPKPEPTPEPEQEQKPEKTVKQAVDTVKEVISNRLDNIKDIQKPNRNTEVFAVRPGVAFKIGDSNARSAADPNADQRILQCQNCEDSSDNDDPPPAAKAPPKIISGGVVNGKARNLVKPPYPAAARAVRASGAVNVQVTIDEDGNVISASAVSGHPLLRAAAVSAARQSKFSPTTLSGQAVKVSGIIIYNFVP